MGIMAGLDDHEIERDIAAHVPEGRRRARPGEIREALHNAHGDTEPLVQRGPRLRRPRPVNREAVPPFPGREVLNRLIEDASVCSEVDLWEDSRIRIDCPPGPGDACLILEHLYQPHEHIFVGEPKHTAVRTVSEVLAETKAAGSVPWPHIAPNPFTGQYHKTRDARWSRRCDSAVAAYRFALIEFDEMSREHQVCFWSSVVANKLLPVAALIDSGGKSIHGWIRVDLPDHQAWDREVRSCMYDRHTGIMTRMGADPACKNPARLSRLPGHFRREKGRYQRLLYLDPDARTARRPGG